MNMVFVGKRTVDLGLQRGEKKLNQCAIYEKC